MMPPEIKRVAVFGAGIAGLTVAHELVRRGYHISVYEAEGEPGGFFRSARSHEAANMPTEYSWHGMGPWYHNLFDLLKQIPFDSEGSVYDRALSRPIDFGIFPDQGTAGFYDKRFRRVLGMFSFSHWEWVRWLWLMLKTWTAHQRSEEQYSRLNAAQQWRPVLRERSFRLWRACFGPWIGSDWTRVSFHHAGHFFRKQLISRPRHEHPADADGPAWTHGAGDGWLLLRGPSSEVWFDRWVSHLRRQGVSFFWNSPLHRLNYSQGRIDRAELVSGTRVEAHHFVLAVNPFSAAGILARTPHLEALDELRLFRPLVQDGPHVQISFRIAFSERLLFPRARTAMVLADTEFNLTLFAQEQVWAASVDLGGGVASLWTGTSCVSSVPGRLYQFPVQHCTREEFIEEIKAQILGCESLNQLVREANHGRNLASFPILRVEVWHEWIFSRQGIKGPPPKWVTTTNTQPYLPRQITPVANLFLAGAHTRTEVDVWSIEGAVESGRRAARGIDPTVAVLGQYIPRAVRWLGRMDDVLFRLHAPHLFDVLLSTSVVIVAGILLAWLVTR